MNELPDIVVVALIVAFTTVMSPLILGWVTNKQRHAEKMEDYARQDAVAAKVTEAARQAVVTAQLLKEDNAKVAAVAAQSMQETNGKIDAANSAIAVVHTLVNSQMTAAMQSELDATIRELAMMHEVVDLKKSTDLKPTPLAEQAIALTEEKINELQLRILDRAKAAQVVADQQKVALAEGISPAPVAAPVA